MKAALKKMQDDVKNVNESLDLVSNFAKELNKVAELYLKASADTQMVEAARSHLEALREATRDDSASARVSATIKKRNLKIHEIVYGWDVDGKAGVGKEECKRRSRTMESRTRTQRAPPHLCESTLPICLPPVATESLVPWLPLLCDTLTLVC